jgi:hypothetical protein
MLSLAIAAAFVGRSVANVPSDLLGGLETTYQRMGLAVFAPSCLAIGRRHVRGPAPQGRPP